MSTVYIPHAKVDRMITGHLDMYIRDDVGIGEDIDIPSSGLAR
jgi:hypothetical protein